MYIGQKVMVWDLGNYNIVCAEMVPFEAIIYDITDYPCYLVRSLNTDREYELYESQIVQGLSDSDVDLWLRGLL